MRLIIVLSLCCVTAAWKSLFYSDCDTNAVLFSDTENMKMVFKHPGLLQKAVDSAGEEAIRMAQEVCPGMPEFVAKSLYGFTDVSYWMRMIDPKQHQYFKKIHDNSQANWNCSKQHEFNPWEENFNVVNLPKSCNYDMWVEKGTCDFRVEYIADVALQASLKSCGANKLPSMSVTCQGAGCASIAKVCRNDGDCENNLKCLNVVDDEKAEDILELMQTMGIMGKLSIKENIMSVMNTAIGKVSTFLGFKPFPQTASFFDGFNLTFGFCGIQKADERDFYFENFVETVKHPLTALLNVTFPKMQQADSPNPPVTVPTVSAPKAQPGVSTYGAMGCNGDFRVQLRDEVWIEGRMPVFNKVIVDVIEPIMKKIMEERKSTGLTDDEVTKNFRFYKMPFWRALTEKTDQPVSRNVMGNATPAVKFYDGISSKGDCPLYRDWTCTGFVNGAKDMKNCQHGNGFLNQCKNLNCSEATCQLWAARSYNPTKYPMHLKNLPTTCSGDAMTKGLCQAEMVGDLLFGRAEIPLKASIRVSMEQCPSAMMSMYFDCKGTGGTDDACKMIIQNGIADGKSKKGCATDSDCEETHRCQNMDQQLVHDLMFQNDDGSTKIADFTLVKTVRKVMGWGTPTDDTNRMCVGFLGNNFDTEKYMDSMVSRAKNVVTFNKQIVLDWNPTSPSPPPGEASTAAFCYPQWALFLTALLCCAL